MQVCIDYESGWFLRINTKDIIRPCVKIFRDDNPFLKHDSHIECTLLEVDEYEIEDSLRHSGIVGQVSRKIAKDILEKLLEVPYIKRSDKKHLLSVFEPYIE